MALALDAGACTGQATAAASLSTSTGQSAAAGAIIVVTTLAAWAHSVGAAGAVSSVTGGGLTFQKRAGLTLAGVSGADPYSRLEVWWAYTSPGNTTITYTANYSLPSATNFETAVISVQSFIGFTGTDYPTNPWDSNSSLPAVGSNEVSGSPTVTGISTTSANTLLLATAGDAPTSGGLGTTPPAGFTIIQSLRNTSATDNSEIVMEYNVVASAQSGITVAWAAAISNWTAIIDALAQAGTPAGLSNVPGTGGQTIFRIRQGWRF